MRNKGIFICFTGIDGSGKTTLSKELVNLLKSNGIKSNYIYNRFVPFILKPFIMAARAFFLHKKDVFDDYRGYSATKIKAIEEHPFLSSLYLHLLLFDYFLQILFKIKLPLMLGRNIVCDRYIYDTIITDLAVDFNYPDEESKMMLKKVFYLIPKPDLVFLVDVPEEIAFQRKDDVPSVDYLSDRRKLYIKICRDCGMIILDGSKNLMELRNTVKREVTKYIEGGKNQNEKSIDDWNR